MILTVHLLTGAAIASKTQIIPLALFLAILSHCFLDFLPHDEYSIKNIKKRNWQNSFFEFLKIGADLLLGFLIILILAPSKQPIIYLSAFFAALPDFLNFLGIIFINKPKLLQIINRFHKKIHFPEEKRKTFPFYQKTLIQLTVFILAILLLIF